MYNVENLTLKQLGEIFPYTYCNIKMVNVFEEYTLDQKFSPYNVLKYFVIRIAANLLGFKISWNLPVTIIENPPRPSTSSSELIEDP